MGWYVARSFTPSEFEIVFRNWATTWSTSRWVCRKEGKTLETVGNRSPEYVSRQNLPSVLTRLGSKHQWFHEVESTLVSRKTEYWKSTRITWMSNQLSEAFTFSWADHGLVSRFWQLRTNRSREWAFQAPKMRCGAKNFKKRERKRSKTGQYFFRGLFIRVETMNAGTEIQRRVFTFMGGNSVPEKLQSS